VEIDVREGFQEKSSCDFPVCAVWIFCIGEN